MSRRGGRPATVLAVAWTAALLVLAVLWVRSPFIGRGPMFVAWSAVAVPLAVWSWTRFRRWEIRQLPRNAAFLAGLVAAWAVVGWLAASGLGAEVALDALIMRQEGRRILGRTIQWLPAVFGLLVAVGGLAGALEARYRLARRDVSGSAA